MISRWKRRISALLSCIMLFSCLGLAGSMGHADASSAAIIIDNGDQGFFNSGFSTATTIKGYNGSSTYYTGHWEPYVTWTPSQASGFTAGEYMVSIYMVQRTTNPPNNADAHVEVHYDGGVALADIAIGELAGSGFVQLGVFPFNGLEEQYVKLSKLEGSSGFVHADAVKFEKVPSGLSDNANLSGLALNTEGSLSPPFHPAVTDYTYAANYETAFISLVPTAEDEHALIYVNGQLTESGTPSTPISLAEGSNTATVVVQAQEPSISKTYTVLIYRGASGPDDPAVLENEAYKVTEREDLTFEVLHKETGASVEFQPQITVVYNADNPRKGTGKITGAPWKSGDGDLNYTVLAWNGNSDFAQAPGVTQIHMATQSVYADNTITWYFPPGDGYTLSAQLHLDAGAEEPQVSYTLAPSVPRYYTAAFTGAPAINPEAADWIFQPLIWQGKRLPDKSYLTDESRGTLPLVMYGINGAGIGVIADVQEMPYRLPTLANSRFGMLLRNAQGQLSPAVYAPVYGGEGSYISSPYTFSVRLLVKGGDLHDSYEHAARDVFGFHDYRENGLATLNQTLDNLTDFILNASGQNYSYWNEEYKAYEYVNDKPGYGRQQSAVYALALALVRDSKQLYEERALPTIEYLASRATQYMKLDGYDPAYPMGGPVRNYVGDWVALYQMSGERTFAFKQLFENGLEMKLPGTVDNLTDIIDHNAVYDREEALDHAKRWLYELISAYRLTGDSAYLDDAVKVTDDYIYWRLEQEPADFYDAQSSFYTDIAPMYYTFLEMYELTSNPDYLEAFLESMRQMLLFIQLSPVVPSGDITLDGETISAWRVSEIGLTSEAAGTSHSHRAIFMPYYSGYLALAAEYAEDGGFFQDLAKSSIIGRYANFPGYTMRTNYSTAFEKADYPLQWYNTYSNTAHMNHPLPMASMIVEYLVSDIYHRSQRSIHFPSRYTDTGAYFKNKVYGDQPGQFYGDSGVRLWLPKGLLQVSTKQINYIAGYGNGKLYLALSNQSHEDVTVTLELNPELVSYSHEHAAQIWEQNIPTGYVTVSDGKVMVQVAPNGITALAIEEVQAITQLQGELQEHDGEKLHEYSFVQSCEPFGGMAGMVISLSPSITSAYVYANSGQDIAASMTLHYTVDDGPWQEITRTRFPFEFSVPLDGEATEFKYYIVDSEGRSSSIKSLWVSASDTPAPRTEQPVQLSACALPDPIDPGSPGGGDDPPVLAFTEDFEGAVDGWIQAKGEWVLAEEEGSTNIRLPSIGSGSEEGILLAGDATWTDYIVEARVKAYSNGASGYASGIAARASDENNLYLFRLNWANNRAQMLKKQNGVWTSLKSTTSAIDLSLHEWYTLAFEVKGNSFKGYVNGELVLEYTDDSLQYGGIGVRTYNQEAAFDDFKVWLYDSPRMSPAYSDHFDSGSMDQWTVHSGEWLVQMEDQSYVMKQAGTQGEAIAYTGDHSWTDYSVEADVKFLNDSTIIASGIAARYTDENHYYWLRMFSDTSAVQLFKKVDGQVITLGEAHATVDAGKWYRLKLTVVGDRIEGYVDGVRKISVTDNSLAQGKIAVIAQSEELLADNVRVTAIITPARLVIEPEERQVAAGAELQLQAKLEGTGEVYSSIAWISDHPDIAVIDAYGKLKGIAPGTAVIRAMPVESLPSFPVHPAQISVSVYEPEEAEQPGHNENGGHQPGHAVQQPDTRDEGEIILLVGGQRLTLDNLGDGQSVELLLPADVVREAVLDNPQARLTVQSKLAAYELPLQGLNWERIAAAMRVSSEELQLRLSIEEVDDGLAEGMREQARRTGASLLSTPLNFRVLIESGEQRLEWNDFGLHYVTRSIFLGPEAAADSPSGVRYDAVSGEFAFVPATFLKDEAGGTISVMKSLGNGIYAVMEHRKAFDDMEAHWARHAVEQLASQFIVFGMDEPLFDPDGSMNRAQFAALLIRALGMPPSSGEGGLFPDVEAENWFAGAVEAAGRANLIQGFPDGTFRPNERMTRAQLAATLERALELITAAEPGLAIDAVPVSSIVFRDAQSIPIWAAEAVRRIARQGIMSGYPDGIFAPNADITRAEAATAIQRLLRQVGFIGQIGEERLQGA